MIVKTPLFQAASFSYSNIFKYNFLNKWIYEKTNNISTPLSCNQKKSSVYKSSVSSSSLTIGTIIGSGTKLNANIVPLTIWLATTKNVKNPNNECISWKLTDSIAKYWYIALILKLKYGPLFHSIFYI